VDYGGSVRIGGGFSRSQFRDMASANPERITLWTLEEDCGDPEYFGKVDVGGASTLEALRFT